MVAARLRFAGNSGAIAKNCNAAAAAQEQPNVEIILTRVLKANLRYSRDTLARSRLCVGSALSRRSEAVGVHPRTLAPQGGEGVREARSLFILVPSPPWVKRARERGSSVPGIGESFMRRVAHPSIARRNNSQNSRGRVVFE